MIVFGVEVVKTSQVVGFIDQARERLDLGFSGVIKVLPIAESETLWVVVLLENRFPPIWRYVSLGILGAVLGFAGLRLTWWMLLALIPMFFELSLSNRVHRYLFERGLRKASYEGEIKSIERDVLIRTMVMRL